MSLLFFFIHVIHVWDRKEVTDFSLFYIKVRSNIKNCSLNIHEVVGSTNKSYEQFFKSGTRSSKGWDWSVVFSKKHNTCTISLLRRRISKSLLLMYFICKDISTLQLNSVVNKINYFPQGGVLQTSHYLFLMSYHVCLLKWYQTTVLLWFL